MMIYSWKCALYSSEPAGHFPHGSVQLQASKSKPQTDKTQSAIFLDKAWSPYGVLLYSRTTHWCISSIGRSLWKESVRSLLSATWGAYWSVCFGGVHSADLGERIKTRESCKASVHMNNSAWITLCCWFIKQVSLNALSLENKPSRCDQD